MKTYVLTVSEKFPATHPRRGELTGFPEAIKQGVKIHTIRANYPLWEKRIKEVEEGRARLSVRIWTGKPYNSPQKEIFVFTRANGVGVEKLTFYGAQFNCMLVDGSYCFAEIDKTIIMTALLFLILMIVAVKRPNRPTSDLAVILLIIAFIAMAVFDWYMIIKGFKTL